MIAAATMHGAGTVKGPSRSRYALTFPSENEGKVTLFSTRTAAAVQLPIGLSEQLEAGGLAAGEQRLLLDLGLLVASPEDERRELSGLVGELEAEADTLHLIVVAAQGCNLACRYCYQGPEKGSARISPEVSSQLVRFAVRTAFEQGRNLHVTFYGGEPLLALDRLLFLAGDLQEAAAARGRACRFTCITNGTLLTWRAVAKLLPLGLRAALVTLDGPAATHDLLRPLAGGGGSYRRIVGNLQETCELLDLQLNANYTEEVYREFPRLLDDLLAAGLGPERIGTVSFSPVTWETRSPHFSGGCRSLNEPWLMAAAPWLREEQLRRGYRADRIRPTVCMVDLAHELVVDCDGSLYKCPCFVGEKRFRIGDLATGIHGAADAYARERWRNPTCIDCPYLPLCFAGCRYQAYQTAGTPAAAECRRAFFEACLPRLVAQDLRYGLTGTRT